MLDNISVVLELLNDYPTLARQHKQNQNNIDANRYFLFSLKANMAAYPSDDGIKYMHDNYANKIAELVEEKGRLESQMKQVTNLINTLPLMQRSVITKYYFDLMLFIDIAKLYQLSVFDVFSLHQVALKSLASKLDNA